MTNAALNPALAKVALGKQLRAAMGHTGTTTHDVATALGFTSDHVARVLKGERGLRPAHLAMLLDLLNIKGEERRALEDLQREAARRRPKNRHRTVIPDRFRRFQDREETARLIRIVCADLMSGVLQSPRVIRHVLAVNPLHRPEALEDLVQARLARQEKVLASGTELDVLIAEPVLMHLRATDTEMCHEQLQRLFELAELPQVTIRLVPIEAGLIATTGMAFQILASAVEGEPRVVHFESLADSQIVEAPDHVAVYEAAFERASSVALSVEKTLTRLATLEAEL